MIISGTDSKFFRFSYDSKKELLKKDIYSNPLEGPIGESCTPSWKAMTSSFARNLK